MTRLWYHTVYIPLPEKIHNKLFELYKELSGKFENEYLSEKSFVAHISLGFLSLTDEQTDVFLQAVRKCFGEIGKFDLTLADFSISPDGRFLFLNLDKSCEGVLYDLRDRFVKEVCAKFKMSIPQKYLNAWSSLTDEEKKLLITTGSRYEWQPHVSIVKLKPEEFPEALKICEKYKCDGEEFTAVVFIVSKECDNLDDQYPVIEQIYLK